MSQQKRKLAQVIDLTVSTESDSDKNIFDDDTEVYSDNDLVCLDRYNTLPYDPAEWDGSDADNSVDFAMQMDEDELCDDKYKYVKIVDEDNSDGKLYKYATRDGIGITPLKQRSRLVPLSQEIEIKRELSISDVSDVDDGDSLFVENKNANKRLKGNRETKRMLWCVTWNNPDVSGDDLAERLQGNVNIKGFVFQKEVGDSGTPHFQMYLEFAIQVYCSGVRNAIGHQGISTFICKGGKKSNLAYCTKEKGRLEGPWKWGSCENTIGQGQRSDINTFTRAVIKADGITDEVEEEFPGMAMRYGQHAKKLVSEKKLRAAKVATNNYWKEQVEREDNGEEIQGQQPRELVLLFGPTGVGKTTKAFTSSYRRYQCVPYKKDGNTKWWDNYDAEKAVLIDEWREQFATLETLNDITNAGISLVEYKGGYTALCAEVMFFTSNRHPLDILNVTYKDARYRALMRRFKEVHWWKDDKSLVILKNPFNVPEDEKEAAETAWKIFWKRNRTTNVVRVENENRGPNDPVFSLNVVDNDNEYFTW